MTTEPSFSPNAGAFDDSILRRDTSRDIFSRLAPHVHTEVLRYLGSTDIASLRLASRTFSQLPIALWRRLLAEEMPWLWELWTTDLPYFWATVTARDIIAHKIESEVPNPDGSFDIVDHTIDVAKRQAEWALPKPPLHGTNWYMLYTDIKRHWGEIKGLRNRKRIWNHLEKMMVDMDRYIINHGPESINGHGTSQV